jgi:hypothetical protein
MRLTDMQLLPNSLTYIITNTTNPGMQQYISKTGSVCDDIQKLTEEDTRRLWNTAIDNPLFWLVQFSYNGVDFRTMRPTFVQFMFAAHNSKSKKAILWRNKAAIEFEQFKKSVESKC